MTELKPHKKCEHIANAIEAIKKQGLKMEDDYNNGILICDKCNCYYQAAEEVGYGESSKT
jgi:hypothetical protein